MCSTRVRGSSCCWSLIPRACFLSHTMIKSSFPGSWEFEPSDEEREQIELIMVVETSHLFVEGRDVKNCFQIAF